VLENRDRLEKNPRVQPVLRTLDRMKPAKIEAVKADARRFLEGLYGEGSRHAA
jgi:deoxyribodipyrimidine photolyase-like uncharacterized protein